MTEYRYFSDRGCLSVKQILLSTTLSLLLSSCGSVRDSAPVNYTKQWDEIPDAVPVTVKRSKYGNPDSYTVLGGTYYVKDSAEGFKQKGIASWYGNKFHGRRTSSGEEYNMYAMTAAHKTLPIPVFVEVKNIDNGRTAIVRVNDRGPFHEGRIIDLSYAAATKLGVAQTGTANVSIRVVTSEADRKRRRSEEFVESSVSESDKLYVQIAAFSTEKNAQQHLKKLQDEGFFDVRLHTESKKGKKLYRVRIGPLPSEHVAKNVLSQLKEKKYHNLKIVKNN
ncbi:MAG: septal ring lytic transglycosylase RlpA family protein [Gammaproteobacteria bacterium]|nr:septal ring lytic transglycosylase RlpA family protein [Gammaproteobacteria bacterium]